MQNISRVFLIISLGGFISFSSVYAEDKYEQLLKALETPQAQYEVPKDDYKIDPKLYKNEYEVDWASHPQFKITAQEFKAYKSSIKVKMTVIASTGYIADAVVLKSSGSQVIDKKVLDAVKLARLSKIPHVDKTVTYHLIHDFEIKKPL